MRISGRQISGHFLFWIVLLLSGLAPELTAETAWGPLFDDNFSDGMSAKWALVPGWVVEKDEGNFVLSGTGHAPHARAGNPLWYDYRLKMRIKLLAGGMHINFRVQEGFNLSQRYFIGVSTGGIMVNKQNGNQFYNDLAHSTAVNLTMAVWHTVEIVGQGNQIQVWLNGHRVIDFTDEQNPILRGAISLESLPESHVHFDEVEVTGAPVPPVPVWQQTAGPDGGIVRAFARNRSSGTLFVGAPNAGIFRSTDNGRSWHKSNAGTGGAGYIFHIQSDPGQPLTVYAVFVFGGVFKSTDDGATWKPMNNGLANEKPYSIAIDPTDSLVLYLGTLDGRIFKSTDGGRNWVRKPGGLPSSNAFSISHIIVNPSNPKRVYAATGWWDDSKGMGIFRSDDAGETWDPIDNGLDGVPTFSTLAMDPKQPSILFAAGTQNFQGTPVPGTGIFKTTDGGESWRRVLSDGAFGQAVSVAINPQNTAVVYSGAGQSVFRSSDGGETWERLEATPPIPVVTHLLVDETGNVYVTGYYGGVSISTDAGFSWVYSTLGFNATRVYGLGVDPLDPNVVYAGTRGDGQFKTTDGGRTWKRFEMGFDFFGGASWAFDPRDPSVVYAGTYYSYPGRVYRTTNAGQGWRKALDVSPPNAYFGDQKFVTALAVDPLHPDTVFAAVLESGVFKSTNGGVNWRGVNQGLSSLYATSLAIDPQEPGTVYAGTLRGGVFKSVNGAESWVPAAAGLTEIDIWSLALNPINSKVVYAGTGPPGTAILSETINTERKGKGTIFKSVNGGMGWSLVYSSSVEDSIWAIVVNPLSPDVVYAAGSWMIMSPDAGLNWGAGGLLKIDSFNPDNQATTGLRSLAIDAKGSTLYAGTIEGGVFRGVLRQTAGIRVIPSPGQWRQAGTTVLHTFIVRNTGNSEDSFSVQVKSDLGWETSALKLLALNYGEEKTIDIKAAIPAGAAVGTNDKLIVTVTSLSDSGTKASAQTLTTVAGPEPVVNGIVLDESGLPIGKATVRQRGTGNFVVTDNAGLFFLNGIAGTAMLTVSKEGFYTSSMSVMSGEKEIRIALRLLPSGDNPEYPWLSYRPGWSAPNNCGNCHPPIVSDWLSDAHSHSASNPRFFNLYNGTDSTGRQNITPGMSLDLPGQTGNCALCHAPTAISTSSFGADMNHLQGVQKEGVACDFCHKIQDVALDALSHIPATDRPGILAIQLKRPYPPDQVFLGPLGDVPEPDGILSLQSKSAFCAPCHSGSFFGTPIYQSYPEWLASPYAQQGVECQNCHMPLDSGLTNFAPNQGGLERPYETLPGHYMPGASDVEFLRKTVTLDATAWQTGQVVRLEVALVNSGAGHHVPTDHPMRNMLLVVTCSNDQGEPLAYLGKERIPSWGGDYSGAPGKGYAKILADSRTGESPVVNYWRPTRVLSDTRLPAMAVDRQFYDFQAPPRGGEIQTKIQVVFRRAFQALATAKNWNLPDIVMAEKSIRLITTVLAFNPLILSNRAVILSWNGDTRVKLQMATTLTNPDWKDVPDSAGKNRLEFPLAGANVFFRLVRP